MSDFITLLSRRLGAEEPALRPLSKSRFEPEPEAELAVQEALFEAPARPAASAAPIAKASSKPSQGARGATVKPQLSPAPPKTPEPNKQRTSFAKQQQDSGAESPTFSVFQNTGSRTPESRHSAPGDSAEQLLLEDFKVGVDKSFEQNPPLENTDKNIQTKTEEYTSPQHQQRQGPVPKPPMQESIEASAVVPSPHSGELEVRNTEATRTATERPPAPSPSAPSRVVAATIHAAPTPPAQRPASEPLAPAPVTVNIDRLEVKLQPPKTRAATSVSPTAPSASGNNSGHSADLDRFLQQLEGR